MTAALWTGASSHSDWRGLIWTRHFDDPSKRARGVPGACFSALACLSLVLVVAIFESRAVWYAPLVVQVDVAEAPFT